MDKIGRYKVTRPLGHGGMGDVFLAHDPTLERDVALKLLHHEPTRAGLRDEAKALAALSHPGIVTIFEIGEHRGLRVLREGAAEGSAVQAGDGARVAVRGRAARYREGALLRGARGREHRLDRSRAWQLRATRGRQRGAAKARGADGARPLRYAGDGGEARGRRRRRRGVPGGAGCRLGRPRRCEGGVRRDLAEGARGHLRGTTRHAVQPRGPRRGGDLRRHGRRGAHDRRVP